MSKTQIGVPSCPCGTRKHGEVDGGLQTGMRDDEDSTERFSMIGSLN
jgi:hypothetical protein